jgi:two-component system nitrate/nitrite response regulator NarL
MRVILVGPAPARERLRAQTNGSIAIVGEFATIAAARDAAVAADAYLVASGSRDEDADAIVEALTAREVQVLELLAEGLPNKAIAARLGISDQTVKFHVAAISGKLGAHNRTEAVRLAVRRGLVTL